LIDNQLLTTIQTISNKLKQFQTTTYLQYQEVDKKTGELLYRNEWITDLPVNKAQVKEMVQIARAQWKIENETFNTLKNQGYRLEHNYGHGKQFLSTVFAMLMLLAFMVDQVAQFADAHFQKAMAKLKPERLFGAGCWSLSMRYLVCQ
jgi:hypothetical protein